MPSKLAKYSELSAETARATAAITRQLPRSGNLYVFGTSQESGYNVASKPYTDGANNLRDYAKWSHQLAKILGLTVQNKAIPSSRISWKLGGSSSERESHFNSLGKNLPYNWSGVVASAMGWNNLGQTGTYDAAYYLRLQNAYQACIARALIDEWAAITFLGWSRTTDVAGQWTFTSNGANDEFDSSGINACPFTYNNGTSNSRYRNKLVGATGYLQITPPNNRAIGVFYDTTTDGSSFVVKVNGTVVFTGSSAFSAAPLGDNFPAVVWIENAPSGAVIRVENTGAGNVYVLAVGIVSRDSVDVWNRHILFAGPSGNDGGTNARPSDQLIEAQIQASNAVASFARDWPVSLVDIQSQWIEATDQEPSDTSHLTDIANYKITQQFQRPITPPYQANANVIRL